MIKMAHLKACFVALIKLLEELKQNLKILKVLCGLTKDF